MATRTSHDHGFCRKITAERAESAEKVLLGVLRELCG
jgi:hypothetical protein